MHSPSPSSQRVKTLSNGSSTPRSSSEKGLGLKSPRNLKYKYENRFYGITIDPPTTGLAERDSLGKEEVNQKKETFSNFVKKNEVDIKVRRQRIAEFFDSRNVSEFQVGEDDP